MRSILICSVLIIIFLSACTSAASHERDVYEGYEPALIGRLAEALNDLPPDTETGADRRAISGSLPLDHAIRLSEQHSPKLSAAWHKWRAAIMGIGVATKLPDATLTYSEFVRSIETRLGPIDRRFMLRQMVPNPGKLAARQEKAAGKARAMRANFEATRIGLRESLILAYVNLQALDARLAIVTKLAENLRLIEPIVEARVTTGTAQQSALLRLQVECERLESNARTLEKRRPSQLASLSAIVGTKLSNVTLPELPSQFIKLPNKAALSALALDHPSVQQEFAQVAIAQAEVSEAGWMWIPDLIFGVEYQMVGIPENPSIRPEGYGEDSFSFTVGLTIPWQVHVNAARGDMAEARETAARFMVEQLRLDMIAHLEGQFFAWEDATRLVELYTETVLPKAQQTLELIHTDFTTDKATLTDVLDAERMLLASELSLIDARVDLLKARARLESIVAKDLATLNKE
ncbi:MAG: TolC family protein [Planctomycetota bacterium]|jgi:outer membrane protein TolC